MSLSVQRSQLLVRRKYVFLTLKRFLWEVNGELQPLNLVLASSSNEWFRTQGIRKTSRSNLTISQFRTIWQRRIWRWSCFRRSPSGARKMGRDTGDSMDWVCGIDFHQLWVQLRILSPRVFWIAHEFWFKFPVRCGQIQVKLRGEWIGPAKNGD